MTRSVTLTRTLSLLTAEQSVILEHTCFNRCKIALVTRPLRCLKKEKSLDNLICLWSQKKNRKKKFLYVIYKLQWNWYNRFTDLQMSSTPRSINNYHQISKSVVEHKFCCDYCLFCNNIENCQQYIKTQKAPFSTIFWVQRTACIMVSKNWDWPISCNLR